MEESNEKINAENEEIIEPFDELQEDLLLEEMIRKTLMMTNWIMMNRQAKNANLLLSA